MKVKQEDGTEIEVFTADEVAAREQAAVQAQVKPLQDQLAAKQEELNKLTNKDMNFGNLREAKENLERQIGELKTQIESGQKTVADQVNKGILEARTNEAITRLSGGDKEVADKIKFHFNRLQDAADTPEAAEKKLRDAYILATGQPNDGVSVAQAFGSGGGAPPAVNAGVTEKKKETAAAVDRNPAVAANLGITKEDVDKYSK